MKYCASCDEEKPLHDFFQRKSGRTSRCKACERILIDEWRKNNKEKQAVIDRRARLKRIYGITEEQYEELLVKQNYSCAICDRHKDEFATNLAIDHNHASGEIRGLLCNYCNHRVIGRHKDSAMLRKMADYVDQGTGWFVPVKKKTRKRRKKS